MPTPSEIQTCIDNLTTSSEPLDFTLLAAETSNANTGISFSVATVNDLPDLETACIGAGNVFFVESIGVPVINTENEWKGLDGRLLRRDLTIQPVFAWGVSGIGQLGDGVQVNRNSAVREISSSANWCQVSAGVSRSAALKTTGQLWVWGSNSCGSLGDGTTVNKCSPVREFCSATDWCQVSAGFCSSAAIKTSGQMWVWGRSVIGDGGYIGDRCSPVREFCSATDWCQVSVGRCHTTAVKTTGQLWAWGSTSCGALGNGLSGTSNSPVREFCSATDWCQASAGCLRSAAVKTTGELWSWGRGCCGSLGDGTTVNKCSPVREFCSATDWCQVSVAINHTIALKNTGEIWAWGYNRCGVLGHGGSTPRCSPIREFCSATDWCQVSATNIHALAIKTSGQLWAWGCNVFCQLGDGTATSRSTPVREVTSSTDWCQAGAGDNHSLGIKTYL